MMYMLDKILDHFYFCDIESVKLLLGKHVKILLKNVVKFEVKADKTENRVLVRNRC